MLYLDISIANKFFELLNSVFYLTKIIIDI